MRTCDICGQHIGWIEYGGIRKWVHRITDADRIGPPHTTTPKEKP
ncbi:hypothetical protein [Prescottella agglutinans]|uniref:Uncharacterized protein n=1 Tax=Prescottella agglutinans TaxID=1644129 RepID=A0ABT6MG91_9NOCA|nr:hypothetical protein [Prescottella agglutinans]MDH6282905.1 hypothetical protein [Prescottella agglutinans]